MLAYWDRDCEWMGEGLQLAICPSFTGPTSLAALDVSGKSNHVTLKNMDRNTAWVTSGGKVALSFAYYSNVSIPFVPTAAISISGWFLITQAGTNIILSMGGSNTNAGVIATTNAQGVCWYANGFRIQTSQTPILNKRYHFVLTTTSHPNYFATLYVDGAFIGANTNFYSFQEFPEWLLGMNQSANVEQMRGDIDDFRIYDRALTAPEILVLYEKDRGGGMLHQPPSRRSYYAQLAAAFSIVAESGSYALTGQPIPLLYGRVLPADTGSMLLSGQTTSLLTSRLLSADQGSYAYSGTDAATLLGRLLDAGAAAYTLDGTAAGFLASRRISANTVAYLASGLDTGFLRSRVLEAGTGQYVLVASPVNLQTGTPGTGGAAPYYYLFLLGGSR